MKRPVITGMMTSLSTVVKNGQIGLNHVPTTGVIALTMTGHSWAGMVIRTGTTLVGMTAGPGVTSRSTGSDSTGTSVLSQPQQPTARSSTAASLNSFTSVQLATAPTPKVSAPRSTVSVTDLETGETTTHTPSRRTGSLTRPLRTGTGLLSTFVSVIAVLNSFGRPQGLPLIPETVSSPEVTTSDERDDVLGRHHEDCFSLLSPKEHWILFDSGAAAHCCPLDYAPAYPLLPVGKNPPDLKSITGIPLNIIGRKLIRYDAPETVLYINYYVWDCISSTNVVTRL